MKQFSMALQLAVLVVIVFSIFVVGFFYSFSHLWDVFVQNWHYSLFLQLLLFVLVFIIFQLRIENFIATKVRDLYQDLSPTGMPINEDSMQKDVLSITKSLQQFAKESKLEIELLKDKENFRREFIGNLAHELKTPLFTVQGYIFTLLEGKVNDKKTKQKYLQKAANGIDRLSVIINDLDFITQIELGITQLNVERFDVVQMIRDLVELLEMQAEKKEINLVCNHPANAPVYVEADLERITQVLTNLVVNSLKYGVKNGTTEIELSALTENKILVRVIDNGKGIAEEHLPRLFERFYRVEKTRNRNDGGSGLGLAIVKHIIEAHGEKIFVESTQNVGSEFSFTLTKSV